MKEFKTKLRAMGFKRKSDRCYYYDNNGLYYVVSFRIEKDYPLPRAGLEVSHKAMFEQQKPSQRSSPIGGWLCSWGGVCSQAYYGEGQPDFVVLEQSIKEFFTYFKTAADWNKAIKDWQKATKGTYREIPDFPAKIDKNAGGNNPEWFINNTAGELKTYKEFVDNTYKIFNEVITKYNFKYTEDYYTHYARDRGDFEDGISITFDELGTFFRIGAFFELLRPNDDEDSKYSKYFFYNGKSFPLTNWIRTADFNAEVCDNLLTEANNWLLKYNSLEDYIENYIKKETSYLADREKQRQLYLKFDGYLTEDMKED